MAKTVVGFFESIDEAQHVKQQLGNNGYAAQDITVVANDSNGYGNTADAMHDRSASEDVGIGEKIGNFFRSLTGGDSDEAGYYAEGVKKGGALLAVTVPDERADQVAHVLDSYGAKDVDEQGATAIRQENTARQQDTARQENNMTAIPVVEEELKLGKRQVQRGGVRVYSHVTERPVEADVQLREEHVRVERRAVDRPATEADFNNARNQTIELTETAEEAVIGKTSRVVEEVVVGKEVRERSQKVKDTVRKTEVEVEQMGASGTARAFGDYEADFRRDYQTNYGSSGASYERYAPAYQYGYKLATDPRYANHDWSTIESQAKSDWSREGTGAWEDLKHAVRSAWDRVRGR
jgi:uncharacterized protein (TIGR02271 family)